MIIFSLIDGNVNCGDILFIDKINIGIELKDYLAFLPTDPDITDESIQGTGYFLVKRVNTIEIGSCNKYDPDSFNFICVRFNF